jgi:hypothetical protein
VANLEVCGMYQENYEDGKLKYLHVFARTHNAPYKYFYRRWTEYRKWSAWEKVQLDIRSVEDGDNSGVHLIPVVWKKRLFLFWPEFMEAQKASLENSSKSVKTISDDSMSLLEPIKKWEIKLAWSEYADGKWSSKQVSKEFVTSYQDNICDHSCRTFISSATQELSIWVSSDSGIGSESNALTTHLEGFRLSDIQSKVRVTTLTSQTVHLFSIYSNNFMKRAGTGPLALKGNSYLQASASHKLLYSNQLTDFETRMANPFFYSDTDRSYFVRPVDIISIICGIREPAYHIPYIPDKYEYIEKLFPQIGPDDYMPGEGASYYISRGGMNQPVRTSFTVSGNRNMPTNRTMMMRSGNMSAGATVARKSVLKNCAMEMAYVEAAFGAVNYTPHVDWELLVRYDRGLEFHTFYHPFSSKFVTRLNQGGIPALMRSDTEDPLYYDTIKSDNGAAFEDVDIYNPNFTHGLVRRHSAFDTPPDPRTAYKENVCFDVYGANSLYNWELFFHAPLYIATRLSKNGKYEEAMKWFHYIFDPTTDEMPRTGESEISRYWKVLPFKTEPAERLEDWFRSLSPNADPNTENAIIGEWRDNPFDPHLVASNRPLAYMKHVVIKYVENLIAWGDSLFRQFTRESVNEALQLYVIANHVLGPYPEFVPRRGIIKAESYESLKYKWDDFSNALVELENVFPYSSEVSVSSSSVGTNLLGIGSALYFCIPSNDKLLEHWDTAADRLFKIRHCQDIDGVERKLALFAPPISPAALIQAASQGLSLGSILADLSSPPPIYRFTFLIQKVNEFCSDVKALGSALLAALEKKDGEELSRLRASHETQMLELVTAIRERQILDAKVNKENLLKARYTASFRLQHYIDLLGNDSVTVPAEPTVDTTLSADSQLPADTRITTIRTDVDESLVDSNESGVKLISKEKEDADRSWDSMLAQQIATGMEGIAGLLHMIPTIGADGLPLGIGVDAKLGGPHFGAAVSALAKIPQIFSQVYSYQAVQAAKMASYIRREQDWTLQANLAAREIVQLDKQITSADIRIQVTEKELENHKKQIENTKEVELFLKDKFTNQELYQWMKEQLFAVYKQSYNLVFDMAKKAEKAYKYEMGSETASFIQYGYWDNSKQGLISGEKLQLALRQLEKSYLEQNRRELELTKNISLVLLNPLAFIELRETGKCYVSLPEELFDLDFQGHYFRRIKAMSLSIPCIAGPYTNVNCSLRLLKNTTRFNTSMNSEGNYEHENDEGLWIDDDRFRASNVPVTSIATSTGQNDAGMFEFNFRDERYLPFEGAGAISNWQIELSAEKELRQFDYSTISDVILHLKYTARENGGLFKEKSVAYIKDFFLNAAELSDQPLMSMFSMKHELPAEWHRFLYPAIESTEQVLNFTVGNNRFPFFTQDRDIIVMKIEVFARCTQAGDYHMVLSYINFDEDLVTSSQITMPHNDSYGGLHKATINVSDSGLYLEEQNITREMSMKVKHSTAPDYTGLVADPSEVEDIFLVFHYRLTES